MLTTDTNSIYGDILAYKQDISSITWVNNTSTIVINQLNNMKYIPNSESLSKLPLLTVSTFD
jgi:hypothetical protein